MSKKLIIDLATLPDEGKAVAGELDPTLFDLPQGDARPVGPLEYDLYIQRFSSELLLTGRLSAPFEFTCVRTLHPFVQTVVVEPAAVSLEIADGAEIDASEALREEILINFPSDPRCDDADEPQQCEIDPRYLAVDKPVDDAVETRPRAEGDSRWAALDVLKNTDSDR
ncbi:uncharacterized protein HNR46_000382 [Haloferula luteola]|uniref:DUF177 domain-containing protein n=1 Tax=Haloferula luteola TaxID=595692 RepID=A0A840VB94_9BACT|nr:DUF177 domain-containing protein [Haloferula luteola]MBB5350161.1 uncharacterized protein [Haloferula luteola]